MNGMELIEDVFSDRDESLIYSIKLSEVEDNDSWYRSKELYGGYSVKSAYNLIKK